MGDFSVGFQNLTFAEFTALIDTYTRLKSETSRTISEITAQQMPPAGTDLDKFGVPWHPDFHSSTKKQTNEGRWTLRKGCNKDAAAAWARQHTTGMGGQGQAPVDNPMTTGPDWGVLPPANEVVDYHNVFLPLVKELADRGIMTNAKGAEIIQRTGVENSQVFALNTPEALAARTAAYAMLLELKNSAGNSAA